ncbi:hypothetical protein niasHS_007182 [Heterodera schachtii]|uniref:Uncharacterized protein n=1 Tax=Heterodera schachtii TaxID=97005 RepID=A0ABD2JJP9_HETSC
MTTEGREEKEKKTNDNNNRDGGMVLMEWRKKTLPQRVSELFQMYDFDSDSSAPFFSSPFLRDKMPSMLFSDRMNGLLERRDSEQKQKGAGEGEGAGVVRHIPIKILGEEEKEEEEQKKPKKEGFSSPPSASFASPPPSVPSSTGGKHSVGLPTDKDDKFAMRLSPSATTSSSSASSNVSREEPNYQNSSSHLHDHHRFRPSAALPHNSPELRRHFSSLFWTPQQARRISEREHQKPREEENGTPSSAFGADAARKLSLGERISTSTPPPLSRAGGGSTITIYTIPITSPSSPLSAEMLSTTKLTENGGGAWKQREEHRAMSPEPYSAIPFKRSSGKTLLGNAISTPSLFVRNLPQAKRINHSPISEKPPHPPPAPKGAAPFPTFRSVHSPPSSSTQSAHPFPLNHHHGHAVASSLPPPLRRTHTTLVLPSDHQQQLFRRDSEPVIAALSNNGVETNGVGKGQNGRKKANGERAGNGTVPTATASPSPLAGDFEDRSSLSGSVSCSSSSSATQTRSKSPSLSSIRQSLLRFRPTKKGAVGGAVSPVGSSSSSSGSSSLLMMPSCVRFRHSSGSEAEEESEAERKTADYRRISVGASKSAAGKGSRGDNRNASPAVNSQSPTVTSSLRLTEFVPSNGGERLEKQRKEVPKKVEYEVDAVEEAIRSLEQFDPSEFVSQQYKTDQTTKSNDGTAKQQQQQRNHKGGSPFIRTRVFLARAEPVQLHPTGSANSLPSPLPERRLSLPFSADHPFGLSSADQLLFSSCHPSLLPSALSSSGSATPTLGSLTSSQQLLPSQVEPAFSQSMDSINRTPRANSPSSSAFSASQQPPQAHNGVRRAVTFNDNTVQHFYTPFEGPPPDYSDSDEAMDDGGGSIADSEEGDEMANTDKTANTDKRANTAAVEAEAQLRKRFFCSQLTDCAKVVDTNALKMSQFVAAGLGHGGWRQSHILRHNLAAIRDIVYTVEFALGELVESLGRISLDVREVRQQNQLRQLARPVKTTLAMLKRVRHSLDSTGWSLSTLSRSAGTYAGQDALDQFVAMLPQLPKDCYKLVQWVYSLSVWRDLPRGGATSVFLPPSSGTVPFHAKMHPPPPPPAPFPQQRPSSPSSSLLNYYSSESIEDEQNNNNNEDSFSNWATVPMNGSSTDRHGGQAKGGRMFVEQQQWHPQNGGALANDVMDGGESTSSTSSILTAEERTGGGGGGRSSGDEIRRHSPDKRHSPPVGEKQKVVDLDGDMVMEEDDLQSVLSEAAGNDVQTRLADFHSAGGVSLPSSPDHSHQRRVNAELACSLTPDQRDLFRLYESQIDSQMSALSRNIEEFFSMIESQTEPKLSFQKVQMILIEGNSLVGIVRVVSRDDAIIQHRPLGTFLEHESARIDALLNECLITAKVAKAKAHTVPAIQAVCSAVVSVSERVHQLKAFWKLCSVGA